MCSRPRRPRRKGQPTRSYLHCCRASPHRARMTPQRGAGGLGDEMTWPDPCSAVPASSRTPFCTLGVH
eukprot:scaffold100896_cov57-Phaeocystis_antarctica.AAC.4